MQIGGVYTIDFAKVSKIPKFNVNVKSCDRKRTIKLILLKNNEVLNLNNYTVVVAAKKADCKDIFNDVKIIDAKKGICEVDISNQMLALNGDLHCEIVLYEANGIVASSSDFVLSRLSSVRDETNIESSSEFKALTEALCDITNVKYNISKKADKDSIFSMKNMGQDIKEAMTGGSVAVVGENSILDENIVNNQISCKKTKFLELNPKISIFNGEYITGYYVGGASPNQDFSKNPKRKIIMLSIKPNTTYSILKETIDKEDGIFWFKLKTDTRSIDELKNAINNSPNIALNGAVDYGNTSELITNYTFTSGAFDQTLLLSTSSELEPFVQIVEGVQSDFSIKSYDEAYSPLFDSYSKQEIDTLISIKNIKVVKKSNKLMIFVPCKTTNNYIRYDYMKIDNDFINMHQWRVRNTYLTDENYETIFAFDDDTEWEGAIWEYGAADFIGGYHGDENNTSISLMIDNIIYDINGNDFEVFAKNEVRIVNTSILNRCNLVNDNVFSRCKVSIWTKNEYIVQNKFVALQDFHIKQSKICLLSCKYSYTKNDKNISIINFARTDHDYIVTDLSQPFSNSGVGIRHKDIHQMELFGDSGIYLRVNCDYNDKYINRNQYIEDFRNDNRCKCYFDITGDYTIKEGESLISKSTFTINS